MPHELRTFPNENELAITVAAGWLRELRNRKNPRASSYTVALSGGRIVKLFFAEVARQTAGSALFENVHFFWADERCVPPDDPESNYAIARQLLFEPLKIFGAQIHRLRGESPEPLALREAVDDICRQTAIVNGQPVLDMVFLGMGEDGHVASLFPGESEETMADRAVYRAVTAVKPPPRRITLGYAAIEAARQVWVVISGAGKENALKESLSPAGKTPLARVLRMRAETRVFTDVHIG